MKLTSQYTLFWAYAQSVGLKSNLGFLNCQGHVCDDLLIQIKRLTLHGVIHTI